MASAPPLPPLWPCVLFKVLPPPPRRLCLWTHRAPPCLWPLCLGLLQRCCCCCCLLLSGRASGNTPRLSRRPPLSTSLCPSHSLLLLLHSSIRSHVFHLSTFSSLPSVPVPHAPNSAQTPTNPPPLPPGPNRVPNPPHRNALYPRIHSENHSLGHNVGLSSQTGRICRSLFPAQPHHRCFISFPLFYFFINRGGHPGFRYSLLLLDVLG